MNPAIVLAAASALVPWIDVHAHLEPREAGASVQAALAAMQRENATAIFLLTLPDTFDHPGRYDAEALLPAVDPHRGKLMVLGGGGTLNAMIQRTAPDKVDAALREQFRERAEELLRRGVAGFGEMTAEHLAGATPYQSSPPDHPLFLLLAGISAESGAPIDLHMEAVPRAMTLPGGLRLRENIAAFERLLAHDRRANVIWAHAGADGTGRRTPDLCRRLLQRNPNLSMELKVDPRNPGLTPLLEGGKVRAEWLKLFEEFPDRFVIGTDQHYPEPAADVQRWQAAVVLLNQLPADLQRKIGSENALRLYSRRLPR